MSPFREVAVLPPQSQNRHSADFARGTRKTKGAKAAPGVNCDRSTARTCTRARMLMLGSLERSWKVACVKKSAEEN